MTGGVQSNHLTQLSDQHYWLFLPTSVLMISSGGHQLSPAAPHFPAQGAVSGGKPWSGSTCGDDSYSSCLVPGHPDWRLQTGLRSAWLRVKTEGLLKTDDKYSTVLTLQYHVCSAADVSGVLWSWSALHTCYHSHHWSLPVLHWLVETMIDTCCWCWYNPCQSTLITQA